MRFSDANMGGCKVIKFPSDQKVKLENSLVLQKNKAENTNLNNIFRKSLPRKLERT
jgi:hypothetical protein